MNRSIAWAGAAVVLGIAAGCGDAQADGDSTFGPPPPTGSTTEAQDTSGDGTTAADGSDDGEPPPPPDCEAPQTACGTQCVDLSSDPNNCGQCGRSCVIPQASAACTSGECALDQCDPGTVDCDGALDNGCETEASCTPGVCTTTCGSEGTIDCADVCASKTEPVCLPPAEVCNVLDDNCDGTCDEGPLADCRIGVHRSHGATLGHYYTTDITEAAMGDLNVESENFFYLYNPGVEGLQPLFGCTKSNGKRLLTSSIECEGLGAPATTLGFISTDDRCGATPLYRLLNAGADAHFYTTSATERDNAINGLGFVDEGVAGYVWSGA